MTCAVENSSGNVFADLGLDHAEAAQRVQPEVAALLCATFHRFSQERLISFLNKLNLKVTLQISRHHQGEPFPQVYLAL